MTTTYHKYKDVLSDYLMHMAMIIAFANPRKSNHYQSCAQVRHNICHVLSLRLSQNPTAEPPTTVWLINAVCDDMERTWTFYNERLIKKFEENMHRDVMGTVAGRRIDTRDRVLADLADWEAVRAVAAEPGSIATTQGIRKGVEEIDFTWKSSDKTPARGQNPDRWGRSPCKAQRRPPTTPAKQDALKETGISTQEESPPNETHEPIERPPRSNSPRVRPCLGSLKDYRPARWGTPHSVPARVCSRPAVTDNVKKDNTGSPRIQSTTKRGRHDTRIGSEKLTPEQGVQQKQQQQQYGHPNTPTHSSVLPSASCPPPAGPASPAQEAEPETPRVSSYQETQPVPATACIGQLGRYGVYMPLDRLERPPRMQLPVPDAGSTTLRELEACQYYDSHDHGHDDGNDNEGDDATRVDDGDEEEDDDVFRP
ncbi:hypothetical protein F5Y16DRAFT_380220 [Xylariaceae sp. FL0255]|nr:hypothetical protein F5Y16DRAFT_380220 [Xylariaceae sp. FL0255]